MPAEEEEDDDASQQVVALYDFDPSSIEWPFPRQQPLAVKTSQIIQVLHDDGSGWTLGHPKGKPEERGYFPKNYTMPLGQYHEMMRDFEGDGAAGSSGGPDMESRPDPLPSMPRAGMPSPGARQAMPLGPQPGWAGTRGAEPLGVLASKPPVATAYEAGESRMLRDMPPVPVLDDDELAEREDDVLRAQRDVERELAEMEDPGLTGMGGEISASRCSTPATEAG